MDTKILELFKQSNGQYLSGEDISMKLKCTRAAVWKHVEKLRDIGYDIEAVPHLGYRLKGVPDKMLPDEIQYGLGTSIIGKKIYAYAETDSTNTIAYELAEKGASDGSVVIAEKQRKGRGRLGRKWVSPPGGVYLSCIIKPEIIPSEIQKFTLVAALSVALAIRELTGLEAMIKWPNDILIAGKKVCGILTEMKAETDKIDFIILGVGLNINVNESVLPGTATSIKRELSRRVDRIALVRLLLSNIEREYLLFKNEGFKVILPEIKKLSDTIGRQVRVTHPRLGRGGTSRGKKDNIVCEGEAVDIDDEGALVIRLEAGTMQRIVSGDVSIIS